MSTKRLTANTKIFYFVGFVVIIVAFLQFGGDSWIKGMMHGNSIGNWNWTQILICLGLGFLIGLVVFRKR